MNISLGFNNHKPRLPLPVFFSALMFNLHGAIVRVLGCTSNSWYNLLTAALDNPYCAVKSAGNTVLLKSMYNIMLMFSGTYTSWTTYICLTQQVVVCRAQHLLL